MTSLERIAPLAWAELHHLREIQDREALDAWIHRNAAKTRKRERHVVELLAGAAAAGVLDGSDFYRLVPSESPTDAELLAGRLVSTSANRDHATTEALVDTWSGLPAEERAKVLLSLVSAWAHGTPSADTGR